MITLALLLEDEDSCAKRIKSALARAGGQYGVTHVYYLSRAVDFLREIESDPSRYIDVMLIDLSVADAHGLDAVVKCQRLARKTPIVALTGNDCRDLEPMCVKMGVEDFIEKQSITPSSVDRTIQRAILRAACQHQREQATQNSIANLSATTHAPPPPCWGLLYDGIGKLDMMADRLRSVAQNVPGTESYRVHKTVDEMYRHLSELRRIATSTEPGMNITAAARRQIDSIHPHDVTPAMAHHIIDKMLGGMDV